MGLRGKEYHIFNQPFSPDEYASAAASLGIVQGQVPSHESLESLRLKFEEFCQTISHRCSHGENNEGSTGDYLSNTKDCHSCFDTYNSRDCAHCTFFGDGQDSSDVYAWGEMELCYQISGGGQDLYRCAFTAMSFACKDSYYLDLCVYSKNCFACVGLKNKQYCVLNRQYTKDEYEALVPTLIARMRQDGEWGSYFPGSHSPYGYNYSVAIEYYPLSSDQCDAAGYRWETYVAPEVRGDSAVEASAIRSGLRPSADDPPIIRCEVTHRPFRLTAQEIEFAEANALPYPTLHPDVRHSLRLRARNPRKLFSRSCSNCRKSIQSTFSPETPYPVVCEECYLADL